MTENQFAELRIYAEAGLTRCIDNGYRPLASLINNGWIVEVARGCWSITLQGAEAFFAVVDGKAVLR